MHWPVPRMSFSPRASGLCRAGAPHASLACASAAAGALRSRLRLVLSHGSFLRRVALRLVQPSLALRLSWLAVRRAIGASRSPRSTWSLVRKFGYAALLCHPLPLRAFDFFLRCHIQNAGRRRKSEQRLVQASASGAQTRSKITEVQGATGLG